MLMSAYATYANAYALEQVKSLVSRQQSFTIDHKGELVVVTEIPPDRIPAPNVAVKSAFLPGPKPPGAQITCFTSAKVHILTPEEYAEATASKDKADVMTEAAAV